MVKMIWLAIGQKNQIQQTCNRLPACVLQSSKFLIMGSAQICIYGFKKAEIQLYRISMKAEPLDAHSKLLELESRLTKYAYLSKEPLPGAADALIFQKLKNTQRMPSKERYFNFYHWYITMSQFALKQIQRWSKDKNLVDEDKLIVDTINVIEGFKAISPKRNEVPIDYLMNIFLKEPVESNMMMCKNKLLNINAEQIGEELKISFKNYQERVNQYSQNSNELRIMFKINPTSCEKLKDIISKWLQVKNIQIKKQMKQKKP